MACGEISSSFSALPNWEQRDLRDSKTLFSQGEKQAEGLADQIGRDGWQLLSLARVLSRTTSQAITHWNAAGTWVCRTT